MLSSQVQLNSRPTDSSKENAQVVDDKSAHHVAAICEE
jgi:hypothetical protein